MTYLSIYFITTDCDSVQRSLYINVKQHNIGSIQISQIVILMIDMEAICGIDDIFYGNFHFNKTPRVTDNNSIALSLKNCTQRKDITA